MDLDKDRMQTLVVGGIPLLRRGVVLTLAACPWLEICGETGEGALARRLCEEKRPDFIVLDLELREGDGLGLLRDFTRLQPAARVLVISEREDMPSLQRAFQTGASGYISKREEAREVLNGLDFLMRGETFVCHCLKLSLMEQVTGGNALPGDRRIEALSDREREIFRLVGGGQGASGMARSLGLSVKTIESHLARIKQKLGAGSARELKRCAADWVLAGRPGQKAPGSRSRRPEPG